MAKLGIIILNQNWKDCTFVAITCAFQGNNRDSIYAELGLASFSAKSWYQKYKIVYDLFSA